MRQNTVLSFLFLLLLSPALGQVKQPFVRSNPEAEGVSSQGILDFLDAVGKSRNEFHSFMFLRHGKVIAEGWWNPYSPLLRHTMYSVSKSFTATSVGFAVSEKKLSVNDQVISFFPEYLPDTVSAYLRSLTVKNLLSMAAGQEPDPTFAVAHNEENWVKGFLKTPVLNQPGSKFLYNSLATYMLSAIVQKVTGQKIIDYLKPRLFVPLGIEAVDWETDPRGINTGGWGFRIRTEDLAKFGQLFLNKGKWKGKQILPASWIEEATTMTIEQRPELSQSEKDMSDWLQGYCYQMWRCRHNAYRGDGAFGQYIIVFPEQDAVIAITSETTNMQDELNLIWEHLLPAMKKEKLAPNQQAYGKLKQKLNALALRPAMMLADSGATVKLNNKTYSLGTNDRGFQAVSFTFQNKVLKLGLKTDSALHNIQFGPGRWQNGVTTKRGPSLVGALKGHFEGLPASKIAGSYTWKNAQTLELSLRYIESPHTETFTCRFTDNAVSIEIQNSFEKDKKYPAITGSLQ